MYTIEDFRKRFKEVRIKSKWGIRELGHALGKGGMYITKFERGEEEMTVGEFLLACEKFNLPPSVVFDTERGDLIMEYERLLERTDHLPDRIKDFTQRYLTFWRR